jgi:rubrerythrin
VQNIANFLEQIYHAEKEVHDAVLRAYHPSEEAQQVTRKMQKIIRTLREEEVRKYFEYNRLTLLSPPLRTMAA